MIVNYVHIYAENIIFIRGVCQNFYDDRFSSGIFPVVSMFNTNFPVSPGFVDLL